MKGQREYFYDPAIVRWGCYFCDMLELAENEAEKKLSDKQVYIIADLVRNSVNEYNKHQRVATENLKLNNPEEVANQALKLLGSDKRIRQCGKKNCRTGEVSYWGGYNLKDRKILKVVEHETEQGSHFILEHYNPDPRIKLKAALKEIYYLVI